MAPVNLDPKGNVVLARFGNDALIFRGGPYEPYVVASGYDEQTGTWSHGTYYSDLSRAWDYIHPDILEEVTVKWMRDDFAESLEEHGIEATDDNICDLMDRCDMSWWKDNAISHGNEYITDEVYYLAEKQKEECSSEPTRDASLNAVCAEFSKAADTRQDDSLHTAPAHDTSEPNL